MLKIIKKKKIRFITGVPDTKLGEFLNKIPYNIEHVKATDEGEAVAIAVGYYLATKKKPLVYMQSDGFSNALNAFTTLVIPFKIPMEIVISVRADEPQHEVMGKHIIKLLKDIGLKATIV